MTIKIGYAHGSKAKIQVHRCMSFYAGLFLKNCKQSWPQVLERATKFEEQARRAWPAYHEEMRGIADGAGVELLDIVALNVRTEINFGLFSDGCTAMSWHTRERSFLAQNWDVGLAGTLVERHMANANSGRINKRKTSSLRPSNKMANPRSSRSLRPGSSGKLGSTLSE